jgi:hypothetical protein
MDECQSSFDGDFYNCVAVCDLFFPSQEKGRKSDLRLTIGLILLTREENSVMMVIHDALACKVTCVFHFLVNFVGLHAIEP